MKNIITISSLCVIFAPTYSQNKITSMPESILAPIAAIKPHIIEKHGDKRNDNYFWLNERENPEVIDYLNKENDGINETIPNGFVRRNESQDQRRRRFCPVFIQRLLLHHAF